ncbi:hypothetical protein GVAV_001981 [Gurleya vavrai]
MTAKTTTIEQYLEILKLKMELLMKKKPCKICLDVMKKVKNSEVLLNVEKEYVVNRNQLQIFLKINLLLLAH